MDIVQHRWKNHGIVSDVLYIYREMHPFDPFLCLCRCQYSYFFHLLYYDLE